MENKLQNEVKALLELSAYKEIQGILAGKHPSDVAEAIESLTPEEGVAILRFIPREYSYKVFEYLHPFYQEKIIKGLKPEEISLLLNEMSPDDRTELLESIKVADVQHYINLLSPEESAVTKSLLHYPEESVGRIMTTDYIAVKEDWTVKEVLDYVRNNAKSAETLSMVYVIDREDKLLDDIAIHEFLLAPLGRKVSELMDHHFTYLDVHEKSEDAATKFKKYDRIAMPVLDDHMHLLGLVTVDDILDLVEEQSTEEIQKFGGLEALDYPYVSTPIFKLIEKRAGWLVILFLSEMLTTNAMTAYEDVLAKSVVLSLFIPLIISSGGNSGSQAATLIIRSLALGEITLKDWWFVMKREILSGVLLGSILGFIGFLRIGLWTFYSVKVHGTYVYTEHWALVGMTVGFSLIGIVLWGTLSGSILPIVLKRFGLDPATSSAPFVATLVDVTGLIIYFSVASFILKGTLL